MTELLTVIVTWLSYTVGLPVSYEHPQVLVVPQEQMLEVWGREAASSESYGGLVPVNQSSTELKLYAFYSDLTQTVYLDEQWSAVSSADVSILVHEMAHHLQFLSESTFACKQEREQVAYEAQARWLKQSGQDMESEFGLDPMTLLVRTRCMH